MNDHPRPDHCRISDHLPEPSAPQFSEHKNSHLVGDGDPRASGVKPRLRNERLPYEITRSGLLAVGAAFLISLCLFWYGAGSIEATLMRMMAIEVPKSIARTNSPFWAILAGASFMGGGLGAAIGHLFRDEKGGAAAMGAFVGALAGPPLILILLFGLLLFIWILLGGPSA
jgi:hypothetical protein